MIVAQIHTHTQRDRVKGEIMYNVMMMSYKTGCSCQAWLVKRSKDEQHL